MGVLIAFANVPGVVAGKAPGVGAVPALIEAFFLPDQCLFIRFATSFVKF